MARKSELKISLFSFQDIITSVTGVMILLTLLLTLELIESSEQSPAVQTTNHVDDIKKRLSEEQAELEELKSRINSDSDNLTTTASKDKDTLKKEIAELEAKLGGLYVDQDHLKKKRDNISKTKKKIETTKKTIKEMEQERKEIEEKIKQANKKLFQVSDGMMVLLEPRVGDNREPWVVEIFGGRILIVSAQNKMRKETFTSASRFKTWLRSKKPRDIYFYLLVHEDGTKDFRAIRDEVIANGFDFGVDLLLANQKAVESQELVK